VDNTNPVSPELVIHSNVPFGIPKLDASGKILLSQLPQGASVLLGYFDASQGGNPSQEFPATNYSNGEMYIVSVGGTIPARDPVTGVESQTLVAVGGSLLYLEGQSQPDGWYYSIPVAASSAANISFLPEGTITSTNVQAAIAELDSETQTSLAGKAPTSAGTAVGTSVTPTGTIAATNVQAALAELDGDIQAIGTPTASTVTFTPTGTISANNVQSAIAEAASEAVQKSGSTMTGALLNPQYQVGSSGDPTKNFTLSVPAAPDGTMKLARGNAGATTQDIMTVDAAGKVAFPLMPNTLSAPIVESGSNANGNWVKFVDGTLIQHHKYAGALTMGGYGAGSGLYLGQFTWTFPIQFVGQQAISGSGVDNALIGWCSATNLTNTSCDVSYFSGNPTVTGTLITMMAIGRWK